MEMMPVTNGLIGKSPKSQQARFAGQHDLISIVPDDVQRRREAEGDYLGESPREDDTVVPITHFMETRTQRIFMSGIGITPGAMAPAAL